MIYNQKLSRLTEVQIVKDFIEHHNFQAVFCDKDYGLILYRLPYVVEFKDALIENYLEIYLSDLNSGLYITGNCALGCSLDIKNQNISTLRARDQTLKTHPDKEIFLSEKENKIGDLYANLEAIDGLLPLLEAKGGLSSIRDNTFDLRFDFRNRVDSMWHGMKERYLHCIAENREK